MDILEKHMGHSYHIYPLNNVTPLDAGFGLTARLRIYVVCVHIARATLTHDLYQVYDMVADEVLRNAGGARPRDCMLAPRAEVAAEAQRIGSARGRESGPSPRQRDDYTWILTERERLALIEYGHAYWDRFRELPHASPDLVVFLGDNPWSRLTWSATSGMLPTFRMNNGLMWIPSLRRFLTAREKLAAMGFPVFEEHAAQMSAP